MQINFTGHKIDITPALKDFTEKKLAKLDHFHKITSINVIFDVDKLRQIAEATITIAHGETVNASAEELDMYSAIDSMVDKLDRQLTKHKEKVLDHRDHRDHLNHRDHHMNVDEPNDDLDDRL